MQLCFCSATSRTELTLAQKRTPDPCQEQVKAAEVPGGSVPSPTAAVSEQQRIKPAPRCRAPTAPTSTATARNSFYF